MSEGAPVFLDTPNYRVRTLTTDDASDRWTTWLLDPAAVQMLNARPQTMTVEALRGIIKDFNSKTRYFFGVFDKASGELIGIRAIYVDLKQREFVDNALIGPAEARGKGGYWESTVALFHYFFEELDLVRLRCTILADNEPMLKIVRRNGGVHEQSTYRPAKRGGHIVEVCHFRLDRETWRQGQRLAPRPAAAQSA